MKLTFKETKIRMVMKLKKLSHKGAVKEIARLNAAKRKAAEEKSRVVAERQGQDETCGKQHDTSPNIGCEDGFEEISAEGFFEEVD